MVKCDVKGCGKDAKYNIQGMWHLYDVTHDAEGNAEYEEVKDWENGENDHFCAKHANIELDLGVDEDE
jgi:hypothetical protein